MLCITRRDRVIMVNPAFERTLGYTFAELESRPYLDVVAPEDRDRARAVLDGLSGGDEPARYEIRAIRNDGSRRWIEWAITSHRGIFYIAGRDVTDRRREQDQLRQAQAKLEALAEQQSGLRRGGDARRARGQLRRGVLRGGRRDGVTPECGRRCGVPL